MVEVCTLFRILKVIGSLILEWSGMNYRSRIVLVIGSEVLELLK